jgi:hypothetical protein
MKEAPGFKGTGRKIIFAYDIFELREVITSFGDAENLDSESTYLWNQ